MTAMPHAFERYNQFANFVPAFYNTSLGNPVNAATGTLNPSSLTTFSCSTLRCQTNGEQFYLNGIAEARRQRFPARKRDKPVLHLAATYRVCLRYRRQWKNGDPGRRGHVL